MTEIDELFDRINKKTEEIFIRFPEEYDKTIEWLDKYKDELISKINLVQSGDVSVPVLPKTPSRTKRAKRTANRISSSDEEPNTTNSENLSTDITDSSLSLKPKRNASKLAVQKINFQSNLTLKAKMRRPGKTAESALNDISNTTIKKEKQSIESPINIKTEPEEVKSENMPPPANIPKRAKKKIKKEVESSDTENKDTRITRSKRVAKSSNTARSVRSSKTTKNRHKDSDVILQEVPVPVVVINDSDQEESSEQNLLETQNNNEDSKKEQNGVDTSDDDVPLKSRSRKKKGESKIKKTEMKSKTVETVEMQDESLYEDALPIINKDEEATKNTNNKINEPVILKECTVTLENIILNKEKVAETNNENKCLNSTGIIEEPNLNDTHIISKPEITTNALNCTVVLQKLNETVTLTNNEIVNKTVTLTSNDNLWQKAPVPPSAENILTDDEDSIVKATPEKNPKPVRKGTKTKQMFSPYANSPVRKRVAAFEKLASEETEMPTRTTRTKTRNMEKEKEKENMLQNNTDVKSSVKSKYFTPINSNKLPSLIPQSDSKAYRQGTLGNKQNSSVLPIKPASAAKPTRAELQVRREEEQKKRLEKEEEAKKKREAIMQAKAEEQRKKREEKQMKAQKAREEMEREKEEKLRQMIQEKEDEQQKKREWQAKKLAEIEERKKAEAAQLKLMKIREQEKLMKQIEEEKRRKKLASKPPPLPTDDCEDSESESESNSKKHVYHKPTWAQSLHLNRTLMIQRCVPKSNIESLFNMEATTPDLLEIFETVDERILRRNSSAVWRTPPKYTTLS